MVTVVLNLKVAMFRLALFPQFVDPAHGGVLAQSAVRGATQVVIAAPGNSVGVRRGFAAAPAWNAWLKRAPAGVCATLGARLALDDRP
jgi:threonine/homoserine/homoserine lactone efflux protein